MRNGWEIKPLADLCDVFTDGDWIESKDQSPNGIRLIQTGNVGEGVFKARGEKARYISETTFKRLRCTEIREGDCLVSRLPDPVGRSCILPETDERMITAVDCTIIRFDRRKLIPTFFNFYSQSREYLSNVESMTTGTTRNRISRSNLGLVEIPVPPLPEQQRIVGILDEAFAGLSTAKANAENNLQNARALFRGRLKATFAPGVERGRSGSQTVRLSELATVQSGSGFPQNAQGKVTGGIPFYKVSDMNIPGNERLMVFENNSISQEVRKTLRAGLFPPGSVIFPKVGGAIATNKKRIISTSCCVDNNVMGVIPKAGKIISEFLYYFFLSHDLSEFANDAHLPSIKQSTVEEWVLTVPISLTEQERLVTELRNFSIESQRLEAIYHQKLTALDALKKSLLHQAFTGQLTAA